MRNNPDLERKIEKKQIYNGKLFDKICNK